MAWQQCSLVVLSPWQAIICAVFKRRPLGYKGSGQDSGRGIEGVEEAGRVVEWNDREWVRGRKLKKYNENVRNKR